MADNSVVSSMEQRVVTKFPVNEGVKRTGIYKRQAHYSDETLSPSKTFKRCECFKHGRTSVSDDPGDGLFQPSQAQSKDPGGMKRRVHTACGKKHENRTNGDTNMKPSPQTVNRAQGETRNPGHVQRLCYTPGRHNNGRNAMDQMNAFSNIRKSTPKSAQRIPQPLKQTRQSGVTKQPDKHQSKMSKNMEDKIKNNNNFTKISADNPSLYQLILKDTGRYDLCKKEFGCSNHTCSNKTIMILGATGSGKTTLINGMINYILGVEWSDTCRFKLIDEQTNKSQAESQTSEVTAYEIHHQEGFQVPYSVTIIDTPGFGDTRGIAQDKEITEKIRKFFSEKDGIVAIDAVCFVVQSALARLTQTQKYISEAILSIFGKDIANNITIMITFADGQKPPVLAAIEAADIPCVKKEDGTLIHFKFNNSALFAQTEVVDDEDNFDQMFWKMGKGSMKRFFNHLETMETKSLQLTKEVLSERKHLEAVVKGVQPLIQMGLSKLEEIRMTSAALKQNQNVIKENENFEYEVEIVKNKKIDLEQGTFVTNCLGCNFTCHHPCFIKNDEQKYNCSAMKDKICTVCPGHCIWNVHHNMPYRFETELKKEKRTYANLKKQYEEALGKSMTIEKIMKQLEDEYEDVQEQVIELNDKLAKSLSRLKAIALRPDPLSTPDYIELLIESEKQTAKEGYMKRIAELEELKKHALILQKVEKGEHPLAKHKRKVSLGKNIGQAMHGVFNNIKTWCKM